MPTHRWFRRISSYEEVMFDAEAHLESTTPTLSRDRPANTSVPPPRPPLLYASSNSMTCLAEDPMHGEEHKTHRHHVYSTALYNRSMNSIALDSMQIGDVVYDNEGAEWLVRQCFCETAECTGKAFKPVGGKDGLDPYDRGRPQPDDQVTSLKGKPT